MAREIRELLLDLPLVDTPDRPAGMLVLRRSDLPAERRDEADRFVLERGGRIGRRPKLEVIGGVTPAGGEAGEAFYALPPAALVQR